MSDKRTGRLSPSPAIEESGDVPQTVDLAGRGRSSPTHGQQLSVPTTSTSTGDNAPVSTATATALEHTLTTAASKITVKSKTGAAGKSTAKIYVAEQKGLRSASPAGLSTELEFKLHSQLARVQHLEEMINYFNETPEMITAAVADDHLNSIETLHKAFIKEHNYFEVSWPREHGKHEYWTEHTFLRESMIYSRLRSTILAKRKPVVVPTISACSPATAHASEPPHKLPDLMISPFNGDVKDWPNFKHLFNVLILQNNTLSTMRKLQYLRGYVQGPIAHLINTLPLEEESLQLSLNMLSERFENRRVLIQAHLDRVLSLQPLPSSTSTGLLHMHDELLEAANSLTSLKVTEKLGEYFMVSLAVQRLDKSTRVAWEQKTGYAKDYPTFKGFLAFLWEQGQTCSSIEVAKKQPVLIAAKTANAPARSQQTQKKSAYAAVTANQPAAASSTVSSNTGKPQECDYCHERHYSTNCPGFRDLDVDARKKRVILNRLYFNCLGRHSSRDCKTTSSCRVCNIRHHTLLHGSKYMENLPPKAASKPAHSTASTSAAPSSSTELPSQ